MSTRTKSSSLALFAITGLISFCSQAAMVPDSVKLYTPFTVISVSPGESIDYSIDIINDGSETKNVDVSLSGLPKQWNYFLKSGNYNIKQLSVLPGGKRTLSLKVEVPLKVNKGNYRFKVVAGNYDVLPLVINVTEQGTFKTEFTSKQANMEGHANSQFTFNVELKNRTPETQLYSLRADPLRGWTVVFKPSYKQGTSIEIEANGTETFNIDIDPPDNVKAGTYKIPVRAVTSSTSAEMELEVVITGTYAMELTTPRGLLSANVTAGDEKKLELLVRNTGSVELRDINLTSSTPVDWEITFEPQKIDRIEAGTNASVLATFKVDKKAITGDYATIINAKAPEVSSNASFRISVKTPMLWGWIGIVIIIAAIGSVYYLFRKYGRR